MISTKDLTRRYDPKLYLQWLIQHEEARKWANTPQDEIPEDLRYHTFWGEIKNDLVRAWTAVKKFRISHYLP
jgi:hypothetical protein